MVFKAKTNGIEAFSEKMPLFVNKVKSWADRSIGSDCLLEGTGGRVERENVFLQLFLKK